MAEQKDIITEASANLPTNVKDDKSNNIESNSVFNEINKIISFTTNDIIYFFY